MKRWKDWNLPLTVLLLIVAYYVVMWAFSP
jgi:hypothetical protein